MCSNYRPVTRSDRMLTFFGIARDKDEDSADVWPTGLAPFIRLAEPGSGNKLVVEDGLFGLIPGFKKELTAGRKTYNARSETVHELPSYRESWKKGWRCIIPAESIYEPNYESGTPVRWHIQLHGAIPMGIAGIYRQWTSPEGTKHFTFSMLTVNADDHPTFKRFHAPHDEMRMVVILPPSEYSAWLDGTVADAPKFFKQYNGEFECWPAALPPRSQKPKADKPLPLPPGPTIDDLFGLQDSYASSPWFCRWQPRRGFATAAKDGLEQFTHRLSHSWVTPQDADLEGTETLWLHPDLPRSMHISRR